MKLRTAISRSLGPVYPKRSSTVYSSQASPSNSEIIYRINNKFYSSEVTNVATLSPIVKTIATLPGATA